MNSRQALEAMLIAGIASVPLTAIEFPDGTFEVDGPLSGCVNSPFFEFGQTTSADGKRIVFASERPGGQGRMDLWMATRNGPDGEFGDCVNLQSVNSRFWDGGPCLSADGQWLYFESDRLSGGAFIHDLFVAEWDDDLGSFAPARPLDQLNAELNDFRPTISTDQRMLIFCRGGEEDRPGGADMDLWVAWRDGLEEEFTRERSRALEGVNSAGDEYAPSISNDSCTLFWTGWFTDSHDETSNPPSVWFATRVPGDGPPEFTNPTRLPISPAGGLFISRSWPTAGAELFYVSTTNVFERNSWDVHVARWQPADVNEDRFLRGDCNTDGTVNVSDATCILNWLFAGGETPGCVAATNTNGDDAANVSDATYLLNFLFGGGAAPVAPFPDCGAGASPADEQFGCANPRNC